MKAVIVKDPGDINSATVEDVDIGMVQGILVKVKYAGLNPIDINTIAKKTNYAISPIPHIPGAEFVGEVKYSGKFSKFKEGDRVIVYPRIYDGICDKCKNGEEHLCINGKLIGVGTNGGWAEYFEAKEENLVKIPDSMDDLDAVALPIGGLTPYHALLKAGLKRGNRILIFGASGNTGIFATQIAKSMGAEVFAISRKRWVFENRIKEWNGEKVEMVLNSLGSKFWDESIESLNAGGKLVTFGTFTGAELSFNIAKLYTRELSVIGTTGGTKKELEALIEFVQKHNIKSKVWKTYKLEDFKKAIDEYSEKEGRIVLQF
ncbi:MAG: alcohol dehydrogenase catalytic domain-containing protein [Thermoplasmata archaeon]